MRLSKDRCPRWLVQGERACIATLQFHSQLSERSSAPPRQVVFSHPKAARVARFRCRVRMAKRRWRSQSATVSGESQAAKSRNTAKKTNNTITVAKMSSQSRTLATLLPYDPATRFMNRAIGTSSMNTPSIYREKVTIASARTIGSCPIIAANTATKLSNPNRRANEI